MAWYVGETPDQTQARRNWLRQSGSLPCIHRSRGSIRPLFPPIRRASLTPRSDIDHDAKVDNHAPTFGGSDHESLHVKLAEIGVRPYCDDLNKRAYVVWHELPDELVIKAESFYREDWGSLGTSSSV